VVGRRLLQAEVWLEFTMPPVHTNHTNGSTASTEMLTVEIVACNRVCQVTFSLSSLSPPSESLSSQSSSQLLLTSH
jgi:hypothetical protein